MLSLDRLRRGYEMAANRLLDEAASDGPWTGELSSSPLSTATAIAALQLVLRQQPERAAELQPLVRGGLRWLVEHQNTDGGWGDTVLSHSNISTSTLVYAGFVLGESVEWHEGSAGRAKQYVDQHGGFDAIRLRYGKDHTFSVPILTQCALAGLIPWEQITPLPFELGCLPHWFYRWIHLPVVSYALPALIAIGQVRHHHAPSRNPLVRLIRWLSVKPTLRKLESIQPESGGFLEATPLTSFVTMSLASMGQSDHPVARQGVKFIQESVRPDGSWPIDTNLATWVTTLSVNALLPESLSATRVQAITQWLIAQQHVIVHRYTNAAPGGWAWTNLSGGVPDADDTPGAILALLKLASCPSPPSSGERRGEGADLKHSPLTLTLSPEDGGEGTKPVVIPSANSTVAPRKPNVLPAVEAAITWLLDLQNSDGGWPTFCRGWGALPFDRSTPDLTAHALRAIRAWLVVVNEDDSTQDLWLANSDARHLRAVDRGFSFLAKTQRPDGAWLPLWFGNQFAPDDENPVYGVSKVLAAYRDWERLDEPAARRAIAWLASVQNSDGGWGGTAGTPSSTEETALAVEALMRGLGDSRPPLEKESEHAEACQRGLDWLLARIDSGTVQEPAPIGLYFAKLWYFERLYPIIFATSALARAVEQIREHPSATEPDFPPTTANERQ